MYKMDTEKDPERAKRLNEVYKYLFAHSNINSKTNFADVLGIQRTGLSAAMNGSKANLTDNLFSKICSKFPIFNLDYLLTGNGQLLTINEEVKAQEIEKHYGGIDQSSLINALIAKSDEAIASLKRELQTKDDLIQSLRDQLAEKDQRIAEQKARLVDYRKIIDSHDLISDFHFPVGVAEKPSHKRI